MKFRDINIPFIYSSIIGFFIFGIVLGAAVFSNENTKIQTNFISEWKEPIGIFIAAITAFIAFSNSIRQNSLTLQLKEQDIERETYAARSTLSLTLGEICSYAEECIIELTKATKGIDIDYKIPKINPEIINSLEVNIRYSAPSIREEISNLTSKIQVQSARIKTALNEDENVDLHYAGHVWDALQIYVMASNLFDYSRFEKRKKGTDMASAYSIMRRHIIQQDDVCKMIDLRSRSRE